MIFDKLPQIGKEKLISVIFRYLEDYEEYNKKIKNIDDRNTENKKESFKNIAKILILENIKLIK